MIKTNKGGISKMRFLTDDHMQKIHEQSLVILENTGVQVDSETALKNLADAGARVDFQSKTVRFPADLVVKSLETVPRKITLAGRSPEKDLILEPGGRIHTRNTGGMTQISDLETGQIRDAALDDTKDFARLIDGLDNIDFLAPLYPIDVPPKTIELWALEAMLGNTVKHINIRTLSKEMFPHLIKMGEIVAGSKEALKKRPVISILEAPISPLVFPDVFIDALYLGGEYGIPIEICSMPNIGATGPITLAGSLLLSTVEHLATIVISQTVNPGAPLIWASRFPAMDMASGLTGMLTEGAIASAAAAQLATEHYNLICDLHGPATNAIVPDGESVLEECIAAFVTAFAGRPAVLCGAGAMEIGMIANYEEMVISDEIFSVVRRIIDGLEINDETLGAEAIARVGIGGNYLMDDHTLKYLRRDRLNSPFIKPKTKEKWEAEGSIGFSYIAKEKARHILKNHQPAPLDRVVADELRKVITAAEKDS